MELSSLFLRDHTCPTKQCISSTADASCDLNGVPGCHFWRNWHVNPVFLSWGPSELTPSHNGRLQNNKEGTAMCDRTKKFLSNNPDWEPSLKEYTLHHEIYMKFKKKAPRTIYSNRGWSHSAEERPHNGCKRCTHVWELTELRVLDLYFLSHILCMLIQILERQYILEVLSQLYVEQPTRLPPCCVDMLPSLCTV